MHSKPLLDSVFQVVLTLEEPLFTLHEWLIFITPLLQQQTRFAPADLKSARSSLTSLLENIPVLKMFRGSGKPSESLLF